jgi:hypothetical protein
MDRSSRNYPPLLLGGTPFMALILECMACNMVFLMKIRGIGLPKSVEI